MKHLCLISVFLCSTAALAGDIETGERLFGLHCSACHGVDAKGAGSVAAALTVAPTDLTRLAFRNGGSFPIHDVVAKIDGRTALPAHGGSMPVYGWFFEGKSTNMKTASGDAIETSDAIAGIVGWLISVQQ